MSLLAWEELAKHHKALVGTKMRDLFNANPKRFSEFSIQVGDILLDYSKQRMTLETHQKLYLLAESCQLSDHIENLLTGKIVNLSEQRPALHTALRDPTLTPLMIDGQDIKAKIHNVLSRMEKFVERVRNGSYLEYKTSSKGIHDIISLGIGGSDLGPSMVCEALKAYKTSPINFHFVSNVDGNTIAEVLKKCDPDTTLCIINSKTFTTPETLQNAKTLKNWFIDRLGEKSAFEHLIGVTANPTQAKTFGILEGNIFEFWDFIGGRYSVWSAVGLPIALSVGMPNFKAFLKGAYAIDQHFSQSSLDRNMPVLMALIGIWNINFWKNSTQAIIPYDDGLRQFPAYLQQLEMESNGKYAPKLHNNMISSATAPVIWGGVGCNGQHAYMQLLHQGTEIIPIDFLIAAEGHPDYLEQHHLLLASCLSQSKALMEGDNTDLNSSNPYAFAKQCLGNRPSNTLIYPKLTPEVLGSLIALYEHKVFVQGVIWGINSFDQWGVELGKKMVKRILPFLEMNTKDDNLDSSTSGLLEFIKAKSLKIR